MVDPVLAILSLFLLTALLSFFALFAAITHGTLPIQFTRDSCNAAAEIYPSTVRFNCPQAA